jgi:hypothetical protein
MSEAEWIQANASLIREVGAERWLKRLLDVLEEQAVSPDEPVNPFHAVNIDPMFAAEHPPLIEREMWVDVNAMQVCNMGTEGWLRQLLDVLGGDVVTAEEVGFAPPGGLFAYGHPADRTRSDGEKSNGKRGTTSKRDCFQIVCSFPSRTQSSKGDGLVRTSLA